MLDNYINDLTKELEIKESLNTEIPGVYAFPLDVGLTIMVSEIGGGFSLKCNVAPCPHIKEEQFLTQVMLGNLFGQGTRGAVLGLSLDGNTLTLTRVIDYNTNYKEFKDILEDFINAVDLWHDEALNHK